MADQQQHKQRGGRWPRTVGTLLAVARPLTWSALFRLVLSIGLSFSLWIYVTLRNNPEVTQTLRARSVEARQLPADLALMTPLPTVDITVSGPQVLLETPSRPLVAYADFAGVTPGANRRLPLRVEVPRGISLLAIFPEDVTVDVEPMAKVELPVTLASSSLPVGVSLQQPTIEPKTVTVTGARSTVASIDRVVVRPDLEGPSEDRTRATRPIPINAAGQEVTGPRLALEPVVVKVTLPTLAVQSQKTVPVRYSVTGQPFSGYQIGSIQTTPALVNIVGSPSVLQGITSLEADPIDITDRRQTLTQTVPLRIPPGVRAESSSVQIEVGIAPIEARVRLTLAVFPVRLASGLRAQVIPGSVEVTLRGPVPRIQEIDVGAFRAEVDLQGLGPGTYQLTPRFVGLELGQLQVVETQPSKVAVQIVPDLLVTTPAPSPSPPTGPTPTTTISQPR